MVPQYTIEFDTKPDPVTLRVNFELPALTFAGDRSEIAGVGGNRMVSVNVSEALRANSDDPW